MDQKELRRFVGQNQPGLAFDDAMQEARRRQTVGSVILAACGIFWMTIVAPHMLLKCFGSCHGAREEHARVRMRAKDTRVPLSSARADGLLEVFAVLMADRPGKARSFKLNKTTAQVMEFLGSGRVSLNRALFAPQTALEVHENEEVSPSFA